MTGGKRSCPETGPANPFILLDPEATYKLTGGPSEFELDCVTD